MTPVPDEAATHTRLFRTYRTPGAFISDKERTPSPLTPLDESEDEVESHFGHLPNHEDLGEGELSQLSLLDDQTPAASPDGRSLPVLPDPIPPAVEPRMAEP